MTFELKRVNGTQSEDNQALTTFAAKTEMTIYKQTTVYNRRRAKNVLHLAISSRRKWFFLSIDNSLQNNEKKTLFLSQTFVS